MLVYRITGNDYVRDLSGFGSYKEGGRWSSIGVSIVYTSERASVAMLESLCYTPLALMTGRFSKATIEIPDDLKIVRILIDDLPENWKLVPGPDQLKLIGDKWTKSQESLVLSVPCVIIPEERNYLLNPNHSDFSKIKILNVEPIEIDERIISNTLKAFKENKGKSKN